MPANSRLSAQKALVHLREGRVQDADLALSTLLHEIAEDEAAAAGVPLEPLPPREFVTVARDIFFRMATMLGSPPQLDALLGELNLATDLLLQD